MKDASCVNELLSSGKRLHNDGDAKNNRDAGVVVKLDGVLQCGLRLAHEEELQ